MVTNDPGQEIDKQRLLSQALANAVLAGAKIESQSAERAILIRKRFGGLRKQRQIVRLDELGNVLFEDV